MKNLALGLAFVVTLLVGIGIGLLVNRGHWEVTQLKAVSNKDYTVWVKYHTGSGDIFFFNEIDKAWYHVKPTE